MDKPCTLFLHFLPRPILGLGFKLPSRFYNFLKNHFMVWPRQDITCLILNRASCNPSKWGYCYFLLLYSIVVKARLMKSEYPTQVLARLLPILLPWSSYWATPKMFSLSENGNNISFTFKCSGVMNWTHTTQIHGENVPSLFLSTNNLVFS